MFGEPIAWDLETAEAFDLVSEDVTVEQVRDGGRRLLRPGAGTGTGWPAYAALGFDEIYLHHVGQSQERFIDAFGEHVLPELQEA